MPTKTPTADELTDLNIQYRTLEEEVLDLYELTSTPRWKRIWDFIQAIKTRCERPACEVEDSKELARIKAIYDTIMEVIAHITEPVRNLSSLIDETDETLFAFDLDTFYRWDSESGRVVIKSKSIPRPTDIENLKVTISTPNGQSVETSTNKIQQLADQAMGKKNASTIPASHTA